MNNLTTLRAFTASQASKLSGVSSTMLDYLCREGFVRPSASKKRGRGNARLFTFSDLVALKVIARLLKSGVEVRRLAKGLRALRGRLGAASSDGMKYLVTDGREIFLREDGNFESLTQDGQLAFAFVIDLQACENEINAAEIKEAAISA